MVLGTFCFVFFSKTPNIIFQHQSVKNQLNSTKWGCFSMNLCHWSAMHIINTQMVLLFHFPFSGWHTKNQYTENGNIKILQFTYVRYCVSSNWQLCQLDENQMLLGFGCFFPPSVFSIELISLKQCINFSTNKEKFM